MNQGHFLSHLIHHGWGDLLQAVVLPTPDKHRPSQTFLTSHQRSLCPQELGWGQGVADEGGGSGSQNSCQMT